jgi:hypothetical protein
MNVTSAQRQSSASNSSSSNYNQANILSAKLTSPAQGKKEIITTASLKTSKTSGRGGLVLGGTAVSSASSNPRML